jgi:hypothetical protein
MKGISIILAYSTFMTLPLYAYLVHRTAKHLRRELKRDSENTTNTAV